MEIGSCGTKLVVIRFHELSGGEGLIEKQVETGNKTLEMCILTYRIWTFPDRKHYAQVAGIGDIFSGHDDVLRRYSFLDRTPHVVTSQRLNFAVAHADRLV